MRRGATLLGLAIILAGAMLLLDTLGLLEFHWGVAWGLLLIMGGAWLVWAVSFGRGRPDIAGIDSHSVTGKLVT
jgi:hypothetical protein